MGLKASRIKKEFEKKYFEDSLKNMTYPFEKAQKKENHNIAVIGLKSSGKSTYVNFLKRHFNNPEHEPTAPKIPLEVTASSEIISITPNINIIDCFGITNIVEFESVLTHLIDGTLPKNYKEGDNLPSVTDRSPDHNTSNFRINGVILVVDPKNLESTHTATHLSMLLLTCQKRRVPAVVVVTKLDNTKKKSSVEESKRLFIGVEKKIVKQKAHYQNLFGKYLLDQSDIFPMNLSKFDAKDVYQRFQLLNSFQRIAYLAEFSTINFVKRIDFVDVANSDELVTSLSMDYHEGHVVTLYELRLKLADKEGKFALTFFFLDKNNKEVEIEEEKTYNVDNLPKSAFGDNTNMIIKIKSFISYREAKKVVASKMLNLDLADIPEDKVDKVRRLEKVLPAFQIKYNPGVDEFPDLPDVSKDSRKDLGTRTTFKPELHTMVSKKLNSSMTPGKKEFAKDFKE